jgi:hypothetical protein
MAEGDRLWQGAAYRLVIDEKEIPVRLVLASIRRRPRTHLFEHLDTSEEYPVVEWDGYYTLHGKQITVHTA